MTKEEILTSFLIETQARSYRLAYSVLRNREEALDAVQTAACRALERQDSLRNPEAVKTWFTRILMNACNDTLRQRSRVVPFPEEGPEPAQEDPEPADDSLARRVDALPAEVGTVIRLRFYEELTLKEIGEVTGQNLNTVKSRLYAGLKKLRVAMEGAEIG
ncbi:sigma-70 family RNA polymerase sigma factor [Oscillospiraceae bacterium 38-13]